MTSLYEFWNKVFITSKILNKTEMYALHLVSIKYSLKTWLPWKFQVEWPNNGHTQVLFDSHKRRKVESAQAIHPHSPLSRSQKLNTVNFPTRMQFFVSDTVSPNWNKHFFENEKNLLTKTDVCQEKPSKFNDLNQFAFFKIAKNYALPQQYET